MASLEINVRQANADFQAIKNKIVANGVEVAEGTPTAEYAPKIDEVYEAGRKSQYDEFWDDVTANGTRTAWRLAFGYWGAEYLRPPFKISITSGDVQLMFAHNKALKKIEAQYFDFSQYVYVSSTLTNYIFYNCNALEEIEDIGLPALSNCVSQWSNCDKLRKIAKIRSHEDSNYKDAFNYAYSLEEVNFEGTIGTNIDLRWSRKLSKASWVSIITHLSETATGLSVTGSLVSVNKAFETSEEANDGSTSAEWLNLIATRPNVAFNLV